MARITVEDCVGVVNNRFELCLVASNRAKSILSGAATTLDRSVEKKEKPSVIALREIADGLVDVEAVRKNIVKTIKNHGSEDYSKLLNNPDEEVVDEIASQNLMLKDTIFVEDNLQIED